MLDVHPDWYLLLVESFITIDRLWMMEGEKTREDGIFEYGYPCSLEVGEHNSGSFARKLFVPEKYIARGNDCINKSDNGRVYCRTKRKSLMKSHYRYTRCLLFHLLRNNRVKMYEERIMDEIIIFPCVARKNYSVASGKHRRKGRVKRLLAHDGVSNARNAPMNEERAT